MGPFFISMATGILPAAHSNTSSRVKLQVRWDVLHGTLIGPMLQHGKDADLSSPLQLDTLPQVALNPDSVGGALRLTDLGYLSRGESGVRPLGLSFTVEGFGSVLAHPAEVTKRFL